MNDDSSRGCKKLREKKLVRLLNQYLRSNTTGIEVVLLFLFFFGNICIYQKLSILRNEIMMSNLETRLKSYSIIKRSQTYDIFKLI